MKRFWTHAAAEPVEGGWGITLDGKPVRTPARAALRVPTAALAAAMAAEWQAQGPEVDPRSMPLTGLANAAIDKVAPAREAFAARLAAYAGSELIAYRADGPDSLVAMQRAAWDPWVSWLARRHDAALTITTGIMHVDQPPATLARVAAAFAALDEYRLAALDPVVTITGSAVLGLAVLDGELDAAAAYDLGHVDARWQADKWGHDPLAAAAEASRRADLASAVSFLRLLAG